MGEVYQAFHPALEREVALKLIHRHLVSDPEAIDRFRREAKVVATLRHPGIVQVFDFDVEANTFYMVMEFIPGQSLQQRLAALYRQNERLWSKRYASFGSSVKPWLTLTTNRSSTAI